MTEEREHLQFLSMFFYAVGILAAMLSLVPALALFVATTLAQPGQPIPFFLARMFGVPAAAVVSCLVLAAGFTLFGFMVRAAGKLRRCEDRRFCVAVSRAACLFVPAGTALGLVTLKVLDRPATRRLFDSGADRPQA